MNTIKKYDVEDRLVIFASSVLLFSNSIPQNIAGINLTNHIIRSSISATLNFGEAQDAESVKDKIHRLSIVLKELKESKIAFKILEKVEYGDQDLRKRLIKECQELAVIITKMKINKLDSKRLSRKK